MSIILSDKDYEKSIELLKDFGLEGNRLNFLLLWKNQNFLNLKHRLYRLQMMYPDLYYIDISEFVIKPLDIIEPPRVLTELQEDPFQQENVFVSKYSYIFSLAPTLNIEEINSNPDNVGRILHNISNFRYNCCRGQEPSNLNDYLYMRGEELWYKVNGVSTPLTWVFENHDEVYVRILKKSGVR